MDNVGYFFPLLIVICVAGCYIFGLIDKLVEPKSSYEKWLEEELARNPSYIDWLKNANCGRDYKLGLKILRMKEGENK